MDFMNCKNPVPGGFVDRYQQQVYAARDRHMSGSRLAEGYARLEKEEKEARARKSVVAGLKALDFTIMRLKHEMKKQAEMDAFLPGWSVPEKPYVWVETSKVWYKGEVIDTHTYVHYSEVPSCGECGYCHEYEEGCDHDLTHLNGGFLKEDFCPCCGSTADGNCAFCGAAPETLCDSCKEYKAETGNTLAADEHLCGACYSKEHGTWG